MNEEQCKPGINICRWKKKGDDTQGKANQSEWEKQNTAERGTVVNWEQGLLVCSVSTLQQNYSCLSLSVSALFGKSAVNHQKTKSCQVLFIKVFKSVFGYLNSELSLWQQTTTHVKLSLRRRGFDSACSHSWASNTDAFCILHRLQSTLQRLH